MFDNIFNFGKSEEKHSQIIYKSSRAYFSPSLDCLNAINNTLQQAKNQVDICVFTISDDRISKEILAAHQRKVKVRILTDNEKLHDVGSDIKLLAERGIEVKIDNTTAHLHHKFAIIDQSILLNGSYNWTRSAAESNEENLVVSYEVSLIQQFCKEFEDLWSKTVKFRP
jgi:phosphatidylserine/phosphatidylglycerophosphate/cardiolipin synthase-like enzyme